MTRLLLLLALSSPLAIGPALPPSPLRGNTPPMNPEPVQEKAGASAAPSGTQSMTPGSAAFCPKSIEDQAGGPCLRASSVPAPGLLFPPPHDGGIDNLSSGAQAFVGGGRGNQATAQQATVSGGHYNFALGDRSAVGGGTGNAAQGPHAVVAGGNSNRAEASLASVGGGKNNYAEADFATIAGGLLNRANGTGTTIGGGKYNFAGPGQYATLAGGYQNSSQGGYATLGGGRFSGASGFAATMSGGSSNSASGYHAAVPGGRSNSASGNYSFAAGRRAKATHAGAFVWGDSVNADKSSSAADEFSVYASGGARIFSNATATAGVLLAPGGGSWSSVSHRDAKENVEPVDPRAILERVRGLPIATWNYKAQPESIRHMGPMAQDFHAAFGLGVSPELIDTIDPDGVALAALQGLDGLVRELLAEKDAEIAELQRRVAALEARVAQR